MALNFNLYGTAAIGSLAQPTSYLEYVNMGVNRTIGAGQTGNLTYDFSADYGIYNDTLTVTSGSHFSDYYAIRTGGGNDTVTLASSLAYNDHQKISTGSGNDTITTALGSQADSFIFDGSGNDTVSFGQYGGVYYASAGNDVVSTPTGSSTSINFQFQNSDDGRNLVANTVGVTVDLAKTTAQNLGVYGQDTFTGFNKIVGGGGGDTFFGNAASNTLSGGAGNDALYGRAGTDTLDGGAGSDLLVGGAGADVISCHDSFAAAARDIVRFTSISDSGLTLSTMDYVTNFDKGGLATDDKFDFSQIDANPLLAGDQAFIWKGNSAGFNQAGGEVCLVVSGGDTYLYIDNDADVYAEMIVKVQGVTGLTASDFIL